jgi:hypothetical protein
MPVKIKAAVDKIKAGVDKIKAASVEQITAEDFLALQEELEEYQKDEEDSVDKIKAAVDKIKATMQIRDGLDEARKRELISDLNNVINSDKFFLILNFESAAIDTMDEKSLNQLRMENTAWERIVAKLELEVDELKRKPN